MVPPNFVNIFLLAQNAPGGAGAGNLLLNALPLIMIGVLFYVMMIRPERQKRVELAKVQQNLKKNDRVLTFAGIYGTVVNAQQGSDDITIKVDETSNTKLRVTRNSIQRVLTKEDTETSKASA